MAASDPLRAYRAKLQQVIDQTKEKAIERIIVPPANKMLATIKNRIQVDGRASDNQPIGHYSTKPMYAGKEQFDKTSSFKPQGKAGKPKKGARVPKTMYLPDGYLGLRKVQGKPVDKMNLTYRGDLIASYQQQLTNNAVLQGLISEREALKRKGLEGRFGSIMKPTNNEIAQYKKEVAEGERERIIKAFRNA